MMAELVLNYTLRSSICMLLKAGKIPVIQLGVINSSASGDFIINSKKQKHRERNIESS